MGAKIPLDDLREERRVAAHDGEIAGEEYLLALLFG
jgi:hypothetical protein